jgi:Holliday junction resolvase RusA-like endonuclease
MQEYFFKIKPKAKARPRVTSRGTFMPKDYTDYKRELAVLAAIKGFKLDEESLNIRFYFEPPKSMNKKVLKKHERESLLGTYHKAKPDLDNLVGAVMDALLSDDSSIASITAQKFYGRENGVSILKDMKPTEVENDNHL